MHASSMPEVSTHKSKQKHASVAPARGIISFGTCPHYAFEFEGGVLP